jgi:hypothetical protein
VLLVAVASLIADDRGATALRASESSDGPSLQLRLLVTAYGLFGFGYVITPTFLVAIVRRSQVIAPLEPWIWIVSGISAMPSVAFWNHLSSQCGILNTFAIACLIEANWCCRQPERVCGYRCAARRGLSWWHVHGADGSRAERGPQTLDR